MSECLTIADETIDQKDTCTEIAPKDIVDFILEEALLSAFIVSDKGCSRIGDFNITDDFRQQQDQLPHLKDFEQVGQSQNQLIEGQESNLNSGENVDRSARENLELIIDSFVKKEEKSKQGGEYTVITEEVLANNELQIQNGQIHLEKSKTDENVPNSERSNHFNKEDTVMDEKIEIEYFNEGKLNKIYVPLNSSENETVAESNTELEDKEPKEKVEQEAQDLSEEVREEENAERPFRPYTTEELRQSSLQVWGNEKSSLVGRWDGDVLSQREDAVRLMEGLSSVQVFSDSSSDPNRPRACAFGEEDVKKMIKEIEEISFTQCHATSEDSDVAYHPDGQGDADLETKSITKSKENITKSQKYQKQQEECFAELNSASISSDGTPEYNEMISPEEVTFSESTFFSENISATEPEPQERPTAENIPTTEDDEMSLETATESGEQAFLEEAAADECQKPSDGPGPELDLRFNAPEAVKTDLSQVTLSGLKNDTECTSMENFIMDSPNIREFQNEMNECDEFFPETMSLSGNIGSLSGSKLDEFTLKNLEFTSELDIRAFQGKRSDLIRGSRSVNIAQDTVYELTNQGTIGLGRNTSETQKRLLPDSFSEEKDLPLVSTDTSLIVNNTEEMKKSQDAGNFLQGPNLSVEMSKNEEDINLIREGISETLEQAGVVENNAESQEPVRESSGLTTTEIEGQHITTEDINMMLMENKESSNRSDRSLTNVEESNYNESEREALVPSQPSSQTDIGSESLNENGVSEDLEASGTAKQEFKLQSQKMYIGANHELVVQSPNEFSLTESEEAFIDLTESVIQIINPPENNAEEDSTQISFSLLSEIPNLTVKRTTEPGSDLSLEKMLSSETESLTKKVYSGMTTIGPIKNIEHDPKDLTAPEIDFGKMTRITSSRQLVNDIELFNPDMAAIKILEVNDSDEGVSVNTEEDRQGRTSLVNRDIASLTKVQKIREVMSYQPRSEEDFEDEEVLARPRLDLKDVESMTDERYKVPDVGIPLLSFEIGESDQTTEKELMESMSLVISGLTNPTYYDEEVEEDSTDIQRIASDVYTGRHEPVGYADDELENKRSSKTLTKHPEEEFSSISPEKESESNLESGKELEKETELEESLKADNDAQKEGGFSHPKYGTLGSVFKKASNKFMKKDGDLFVRNSKSLPRDTSRMSATDSIRSMIDDCQSSASNILKKSRSLLKNTQNVFKSISQGRVSPEAVAGHSADQKKPFPSESDVSKIERKFSSFLKKEDLTKAKNLIKDKVGKALKSIDTGLSPSNEPENTTEKKDLQVVVRNKESLQVDRLENFKKLLPKTPLVYKSQFVKSQMDVQSNPAEPENVATNSVENEEQKNEEETLNICAVEDSGDKIPKEDTESREETESEREIGFQEKLQWINSRENIKPLTSEELEPPQPDFIVMETVQGLPTGSDLESPSSEKENLNIDNIAKVENEKEGDDLKKTEASNSLQMFSDGGHDVAPCFPEVDDEKALTKSPSEGKIKTKKKKFTARFRNFWSSAFGRVKTPPPAKGDLS